MSVNLNRELLPICRAIQIDTIGGSRLAYVDIDFDIKIGSDWFIATGAFESFTIEQEVSLAISTTKLKALKSDKTIPVEWLLNGKLDNARIIIAIIDLQTTYNNIEEAYILQKGVVGEITIKDNDYEIELRSLETLLNQHQARKTSNACHYRFGSIGCGKDLSDYTRNLIITQSSLVQITYQDPIDTSNGQYSLGYIEFTSGENSGLKREIAKLDTVNRTILFYQPLVSPAQALDTCKIIAGCGKNTASCKDYDNIINFGGFPSESENWMRGVDFLIAAPEKD